MKADQKTDEDDSLDFFFSYRIYGPAGRASVARETTYATQCNAGRSDSRNKVVVSHQIYGAYSDKTLHVRKCLNAERKLVHAKKKPWKVLAQNEPCRRPEAAQRPSNRQNLNLDTSSLKKKRNKNKDLNNVGAIDTPG